MYHLNGFRNLHIRTLAFFCITVFAICLLSPNGIAFAKSPNVDPPVLSAQDITSAGKHCTLITTTNAESRKEKTVRVPCPANTVIHYEVISLSLAIAKHSVYVSFDTSKSSLSQLEDAYQRLRQTIVSRQMQSLLMAKKARIEPATACGGPGTSKSADYTDSYGAHFSGSISYFRLSNCNVTFDTASLHVYSAGDLDRYSWTYDQYSNGTFETNCDVLTSGSSYSHGGIGGVYGSGYGYVMNIGGSAQCTLNFSSGYEVYIYPIN